MPTHTLLFIGGEWTPGSTGETFETVDPATRGEVLGTAAAATEADVDAAVEAATRAFADPAWRGMTPSARGRMLWRIADLIGQHADQLGELESRTRASRSISPAGAWPVPPTCFRYFAGWTTKLTGVTSPVSFPGMLHYTSREPVGDCALITPWNFPLSIAVWKLAPALAAGNAAILKPAEQTPLTTVRLTDLCVEAGVPAGVVNVLTGGPEVGQALVAHDGVDKVSFTGSTAVGREIVRTSAGNLKRVSLELGGKNASIVLQDADIDRRSVATCSGAGQQRTGLRGVQSFLCRRAPGRRVHRKARGRDVRQQPGRTARDRGAGECRLPEILASAAGGPAGPHRQVLDIHLQLAAHDPRDEHPGQVDLVRTQRAHLDDLVHFGDGHPGRLREADGPAGRGRYSRR
jgi:hypothetical protein